MSLTLLHYRWDYGLLGAYSPFLGTLQSEFLVGGDKLELWRLFTNSLKSFPNRRHALEIKKKINKIKQKTELATSRCRLKSSLTRTTFTQVSFAMIALGNKNRNVVAPNTPDSWRGRSWKGREMKLLTVSPQRLETCVPVRTPQLSRGRAAGCCALTSSTLPPSVAQCDRICKSVMWWCSMQRHFSLSASAASESSDTCRLWPRVTVSGLFYLRNQLLNCCLSGNL